MDYKVYKGQCINLETVKSRNYDITQIDFNKD